MGLQATVKYWVVPFGVSLLLTLADFGEDRDAGVYKTLHAGFYSLARLVTQPPPNPFSPLDLVPQWRLNTTGLVLLLLVLFPRSHRSSFPPPGRRQRPNLLFSAYPLYCLVPCLGQISCVVVFFYNIRPVAASSLLVSTPLLGCSVLNELVLSSTPRDGHIALLLPAIPSFLLSAPLTHPSLRLLQTPVPHLLLFRVPPPPPFRSSGVILLSASPSFHSAAIPPSSIRCFASLSSHVRQPTLQSRRRFSWFVRPGRWPPSDSVLSLSLCFRFFSSGLWAMHSPSSRRVSCSLHSLFYHPDTTMF